MFGRFVTWGLLALLLWIGAGAPMPPERSPVRIAADTDFPCRGHGCGCRDAEMCRTSCCCVKPRPTCCASRKAARPSADSGHETAAETTRGGAPVLTALKCKDVSLALAGGFVFPPVTPVASIVPARSAERLHPVATSVPASRTLAPAENPPEAS